MKYSAKTVNTYIRKVKAEIEGYRKQIAKGEFLAVCISKGNRKIGHVPNVSTAPIICCHNCRECKHCCYDIKACLRYKESMLARARNTALALYNPDEYFSQILRYVSKIKSKFFRWHVGGDLLNYDYLLRVIEIAVAVRHVTFWLYTKNYELVNRYIAENGNLPENLHIMFSEWDGTEMINPYNQPEFSCRLSGGNKNHSDKYFEALYKCPGNCDECIRNCRGCVVGETAYVDEH